MSSLALAASPYNSGAGDQVRAKRQSTMRRPPRANPQPSSSQSEYSEYQVSTSSHSSSSSTVETDSNQQPGNSEHEPSYANTLLPDTMQDMQASNDFIAGEVATHACSRGLMMVQTT